MNMIDNSLFLIKIGDHYNLQTKVTPCMNIIELAATYFKFLKTALKHVSSSMTLMSSRQRLGRSVVCTQSGPWIPVHGRCYALELVTLPKVLLYFAH